MCEFCERLTAACDADVHGCGSTPARDPEPVDDEGAKDETWRDRPPLL